MGEF
ncbi:hypothetical protein Tco_0326258, partial [Tanacetum coccineum]